MMKHLIKRAIFALVYLSGLSTIYRWCTFQRARILCYHRISQYPQDPLLDVSQDTLSKQMEYLAQAYRPASLARIAGCVRARQQFAPSMVSVTFDDGSDDWLHHALPILEAHAIPATFFVSTGYIGKGAISYPPGHTPADALTREELIRLSQHPLVTIGAHTANHPRLSQCASNVVFHELSQSRHTLERWINKPVRLFAYPYGTPGDYEETTKLLSETAGFDVACTLLERTATPDDDPHELPRLVIFDEPLWMFKVRVSGIMDDAVHCFRTLRTKLFRTPRSRAVRWQEIQPSMLQNQDVATVEALPKQPNPRVSIIVRAHDVGCFLRDALASIEAQTYRDWETLIMDDASTDATHAIAREFAHRDTRFRLIRTSRPWGRSENANLGLTLARGEFTAILDGDDVWNDPDKLAREVSELDRHPSAVLVAGGFERVNASRNQVIVTHVYPHLQSDEAVRDRLLAENVIPHSGVLYRTAVAQRVGGYRKRWRYTEDYELWLRMGRAGTFRILADIGCQHRFHEGNISVRRRTRQTLEELKLVWKYRHDYPRFIPGIMKRSVSLAGSLLPKPMKQFIRSWYHPAHIAGSARSPAHPKSDDRYAYHTIMIDRLNDLPPAYRAAWERVCAGHAASFFQSPLWCETWWKYFGRHARPFLLFVLNREQEIVAVFPAMIARRRKLLRRYRVLSFIGRALNDVNDIWCVPGHEGAVSALVQELARTHGHDWDVLELNELPESSPLTAVIHDSALGNHSFSTFSVRRPLIIKQLDAATTPVSPRLSKNDLNNHYNKLSRIATPIITRYDRPEEISRHFPHVITLNNIRSREADYSSLFQSALMRQFFTALLGEPRTNAFRAELSSLSVADEAIAYAITLHTPLANTYYFNTFNPRFRHFSPAGLLMRELLRDFYSSQSVLFDFGRGEWPYKLRFATSTVANVNVIAAPYFPTLIKCVKLMHEIKSIIKRSPFIHTTLIKIRKRVGERAGAMP